jgi:hypothetical protein
MKHQYAPEQREFIKCNAPGRSNGELTNLFNGHFGISLSIDQIKGFKKNSKISSGLDGRFNKGHAPFNKGRKKYWIGGEETQFKKGNRPHNYKPVGTERVNADDYVDIKVADPNKWKGKHIIVWEEHNGPVPKGSVVIFGDGNRRNFDINNLIALSRKQLYMMNKNHLIQNDADLTRTNIIVADIIQKISDRKRRK